MVAFLFSYQSKNSIIHKIPAILKILLLCILSIRLFSTSYSFDNKYLWIQCCIYLLISIIFFFLSKISFHTITKLFYLLILFLLIVIFQTLSFGNQEQYQNQKYYFIVNNVFGLNFLESFSGLLYTFRFFITSFFALIVFSTTSSYEITNTFTTIENIFCKPFPFLRKLQIALIISSTIKFIPLVFSTWDKVSIAVKSRKRNNSFSNFLSRTIQCISSTLSCLLQSAQETQKAINNRLIQ